MNSIKRSGVGGVALQITKDARTSGLVDETQDGDTTHRAEVRVYAFNDLLLVVDLDKVSDEHIAALVARGATQTNSIHQAVDARVMHSGNGYCVQLPPADDAGFSVGDPAGSHPAPGLIVISKGKGPGADQAARLASDLVDERRAQVGDL
ncbi:hypothetical protein SAMN05444271_1711 [Halohasta litchfieldiae]|jgi:hypothetical protein|uniref:Uncharacterized protein n=1 Tax=Halohasta litchfieldiae TaxID=1073996 RepID=A0A1H6YCY3_9EURY|nr:hypothetical protein [Halohasta litchfieldiae]SEJ39138.1 hypothetical protein SAMN05444271_1711 [Halohasta litchfieldiae]